MSTPELIIMPTSKQQEQEQQQQEKQPKLNIGKLAYYPGRRGGGGGGLVGKFFGEKVGEKYLKTAILTRNLWVLNH